MTREKKEIREKAIQIMKGRLFEHRAIYFETAPRKRDPNGNYRNRYRVYTTIPHIQQAPELINSSATIAAILDDRTTSAGELSTYRYINEIKNDLAEMLYGATGTISAYLVGNDKYEIIPTTGTNQ